MMGREPSGKESINAITGMAIIIFVIKFDLVERYSGQAFSAAFLHLSVLYQVALLLILACKNGLRLVAQ